MTLLKSLDVAIGMAFLYLLMTFLASALVEMISNFWNWRARMLHDAIHNMLRHSELMPAKAVYDHPLVVALGRGDAAPSRLDLFEYTGWTPKDRKGTQPSYIPAAVFSASVLQYLNARMPASTLSPEATIQAIRDRLDATDAKVDTTDEAPDTSDEARDAAGNKPGNKQGDRNPDALRSVLETTLATQGPSVQGIRLAIEKWYNDTMDRVTGWYKRRTQAYLLTIGLAVALGCNVNSIGVILWLWQGDAAREAVVAAAADYLKTHPSPPGVASAKPDEAPVSPPTLGDIGTSMIAMDRQLVSLQYPIGWPPVEFGPAWLLQYLIGSLITAMAISMGSSFWFDALQSLLKMRGTGPKPGAR